MTKKIIIILWIFLAQFTVFCPAVYAISIGVKPKELFINSRAGEVNESEILITNTGDEPGIYQVKEDSNNGNIDIIPENFRLGPQESQIVKLRTKFLWRRDSKVHLSVLSRPPAAGGLQIAGGVKVPLHIKVTGIANWLLAFGVIIVIGLWLIIGYIFKKKKFKINN